MSQQGQVFELKATGPPDQRGLEELGARYKRCLSPERPNGVDQADLYQHEPEQVAAPVYPREGNAEAARAEALGPWRGVGTTFVFRRLATESAACRHELASLLRPIASTFPS